MIALLRGRVAAAAVNAVVVDCAGVGYRVLIPPGTPVPGIGSELTLHTHLAVREDAMTLYGFTAPAARDLFETLLGVTGVGPKLALAALGTLGADGLRRAVAGEDVAALTVIPGVGRKSAQRIILELAEKLGPSAPAVVPGSAARPKDEVREALSALGYGAAETAAVLQTLPDDDDAVAEELLREALRAIGAAGGVGNGARSG